MIKHLQKLMSFMIVALALVSCAREEPAADVILDSRPTPYHIVKRGETLEGIASKYGMSKKALTQMNRLKAPYKVYPGQRLLVRVEGEDDNPNNDPAGTTIKPRTNLADTGDVEVKELPQTGPGGGTQGSDSNGPAGGLSTMGSGVPGSSTFGGAASGVSGGVAGSGAAAMNGMGGSTGMAPDAGGVEPRRMDAPMSAGKLTWPAQGQVIKSFGIDATGQRNNGINIAVPSGTPVVAADNGVITHVGNKARGFGNLVVMKHQGGKLSVYGHLQQASVREGQTVAAGEQLGLAGNTGGVNQSQVHFELRQGKTPLNPEDYLK